MDLYLIIWSEKEGRFTRVPVPEGTKGVAFFDPRTNQQIDALGDPYNPQKVTIHTNEGGLGILPIASNSVSIEVVN
jgi:hypothetical protein